MPSKHQSVNDYIAARKAGDNAACDRLVDEVKARFATRTTDGSEIAEMTRASMTVPFNGVRR
jgi:hypothetical protein